MTNTSGTPAGPASPAEAAASDTTLAGDLIRLRREIHADPELGLELPRTRAKVLEALGGLRLEVALGEGLTSIVAVLRGGGSPAAAGDRPAVLLRADMDALPVVEKTGLPFASTNGAMHACGHDLHTTGLVGAARLLAASRERLAGDVIFMFQPGEEGYDGAGKMLAAGVLDAAGHRPIAAYGLHVASDAPSGLFTTRPGPYMSAFGELAVTVMGRGGHGSRPFQGLDPVQVAAQMIGELQTYITRRFDVFDPVILTVGQFNAGTAPNVIPDSAEFRAGVRSFSPLVEARLGAELPSLLRGLAAAHGLTAEVSFTPKLPVTVNAPAEARFWADTARGLFGVGRFEPFPHPKSGSEDFSRILLEVPGSYGHLGVGMPEVAPEDWAPLHSSRAMFNDEVLPDHALFLATLAFDRLAGTPTVIGS